MRYILVVMGILTFSCIPIDNKTNFNDGGFPKSWTMLRIENSDTLRYKDCADKILGIEILDSSNLTEGVIIFKWSMGNDSSAIKRLERIDPNLYYILTDNDSIGIEIKDAKQGIASFHHAQEIHPTTYMSSKNAGKYKVTNYDCDD
jgi:hypothetical protein